MNSVVVICCLCHTIYISRRESKIRVHSHILYVLAFSSANNGKRKEKAVSSSRRYWIEWMLPNVICGWLNFNATCTLWFLNPVLRENVYKCMSGHLRDDVGRKWWDVGLVVLFELILSITRIRARSETVDKSNHNQLHPCLGHLLFVGNSCAVHQGNLCRVISQQLAPDFISV